MKNALTSRKIKDELCGLFCFKYSEEFELNLDYYNRMIEIEKLLVGRMGTFGGFLGKASGKYSLLNYLTKLLLSNPNIQKVNKQLTNVVKKKTNS